MYTGPLPLTRYSQGYLLVDLPAVGGITELGKVRSLTQTEEGLTAVLDWRVGKQGGRWVTNTKDMSLSFSYAHFRLWPEENHLKIEDDVTGVVYCVYPPEHDIGRRVDAMLENTSVIAGI